MKHVQSYCCALTNQLHAYMSKHVACMFIKQGPVDKKEHYIITVLDSFFSYQTAKDVLTYYDYIVPCCSYCAIKPRNVQAVLVSSH